MLLEGRAEGRAVPCSAMAEWLPGVVLYALKINADERLSCERGLSQEL